MTSRQWHKKKTYCIQNKNSMIPTPILKRTLSTRDVQDAKHISFGMPRALSLVLNRFGDWHMTLCKSAVGHVTLQTFFKDDLVDEVTILEPHSSKL